jgi:hypothetical protein
VIGRGAALAVVVLAIVRHDLWWWNDPRLVLGLPIGLTYHVLFCLAVSVVMAFAVRAVPEADDAESPERGERP